MSHPRPMVLACVCSSVVPVFAAEVALARTLGHHLIWMLLWIALWRAVHRFGLVLVCVLVVLVLAIVGVVSSTKRKQGRRGVRSPSGGYQGKT